ncbi:MAG: transposase [Burkholderiaceae bacterium]|nr:transposase [Burkholderiaceae bacterium]
MARLPRLSVPGYPHLLVQRSVAGQAAFLADTDYEFMLSELASLGRRHEVAIHAYALMPDQFHLLVTPSDARALSLAMQALGRRYVRAFNRRHGRSGTLWQARFRCTVVDPENYLLPCSLFIELCPQRSRLAADALSYPWSSLSHHVGLRADPAITEHPEVWKLGNTPFERQAEYRRRSEAGLAQSEVEKIHNAVEHGWALGNGSFLNELATKTKRRLVPLPVGRPRRVQDSASATTPVPVQK